MVADFEAGAGIVRALAQARCAARRDPALRRDETAGLARAVGRRAARNAGRSTATWACAAARGGCMLIAGWEGERESVDRRRALSLASSAARAPSRWAIGRPMPGSTGASTGPYLRDELMDLGVLVETLETSHTWSRLEELYEAVGGAMRDATAGGPPAIVMCHVSHAYRDGASLYFTFVARARPGEEIEQWRAAKTAACEAIVALGGRSPTITPSGRDHAPYMRAEVGELGIEALRALKERLDPAGIMNPGKLLP